MSDVAGPGAVAAQPLQSPGAAATEKPRSPIRVNDLIALALLAAAELWAQLGFLVRNAASRDRRRAGPLAVALALLPLSIVSSLLLQRLSERLALEQLGSEFSSQVLDQRSRREIVLMLARPWPA